MKKNPRANHFNENESLSKEEATILAAELTKRLQAGEKPISSESYIKKIIAGLSDQRGLLRRTFSESLGLIGKEALPGLRKVLLKSKNVTARRAAAKTLKLVGNPSVLPDLLEALINDEDPVVQGSSVGAMAIFGEEAVAHLIEVLENPLATEMQCGLACWGLCFIGKKGASALKRASLSRNPKVRASSIAALGEQIQVCSDQEAKIIVKNALLDHSIEVQIETIKLIGLLIDEDWDLILLTSKLNHHNKDIRKQTALSLMKLNATNQINKLKERLFLEKDQNVKKILNLSINALEEKIND